MPLKRRAPAPTFPVGYLQSPQDITPTNLSTQSSPFLTPPVSSGWNSSPPPRPDAGDYLTSRAPRSRRRKHHARHERKLYNTREEAGEVFSQHEHSDDTLPQDTDSKCSVCESKSAVTPGPGHSTSIRSPPEGILPGFGSLHEANEFDPARPLTERVADHHTSTQKETSAMIALRRLSQSATMDTSSKSGSLRRMSEAIASSFGIINPIPAEASGNAAKVHAKQPHGSIPRRPSAQTITEHSRRGSLKLTQKPLTILEIPTAISLRKASHVYQSNIKEALNSHADIPKTNSKAGSVKMHPPAVELVAFYSEHKSQFELPMPTDTAGSKGFKRRTSSIVQTSKSSDVRRQSCAAELAITYADVHIAPGTFSAGSISKEDGIPSDGSIQRVSAVQLRSSSSVHEIIWREDESASGSSISCSSQGSVSPLRATQFLTIGTSGLESGMGLTDSSTDVSMKSTQVPFLTEGASSGLQVQNGFSKIFWDKRPARVGQDANSKLYEKTSGMKNGLNSSGPRNPNSSQPKVSVKKRDIRRNMRVSRSEGTLGLESFPPLPQRNSTKDWRMPPIRSISNALTLAAFPPVSVHGTIDDADRTEALEKSVASIVHKPRT